MLRLEDDQNAEFIEKNKDKPFFVYLPHSMPHIPLFVPDDVRDPDPKNAYTCVIEHIDAEVGRIAATLRKHGLDKNTYVVFTSDNGPWLQFKNHGGSALPLRSGKGTTYEGGQRVPCVVWGPGRIPAGTTSDEFATTMDLFPTIAALSSTQPSDRKIDGMDITATLQGDAPSPRKEMVYYTARGGLKGLRQGDWKLLIPSKGRKGNMSGPIELFNLAKDGIRFSRAYAGAANCAPLTRLPDDRSSHASTRNLHRGQFRSRQKQGPQTHPHSQQDGPGPEIPDLGERAEGRAAMIKAMDNAVGTVLDTLDELKLAENTIVIFTSDNGPMGDVSNARPLRGSKGMYYEGGIREPLFIRWPGTIKPGGESNTPVHQNDLFPTLVKAANAKPPGLLDGRDITPILKGDNLADDPSEQTNLATSKPEKRNALHQELIAWRNATNAPVPTERNPEYQAR